MALSRTVSEIYGDFSRQSQNFPTPFYFASPLKGFPLQLGTGAVGQKARIMGLSGRQRSLMISSAIRIECTNIDRQTDRQTDGRTSGHSKDREYA